MKGATAILAVAMAIVALGLVHSARAGTHCDVTEGLVLLYK